jgi:WD40 repeat protein
VRRASKAAVSGRPAAGGSDGTVRVWAFSPDRAALLRRFDAHAGPVAAVAWTSETDVRSLGRDGVLVDAGVDQGIRSRKRLAEPPLSAAALSSDGSRAAWRHAHGVIRVADAAAVAAVDLLAGDSFTGSNPRPGTPAAARIRALTFSADGSLPAAALGTRGAEPAGDVGVVLVWRVAP